MGGTLAERLDEARRRAFVGRRTELDAFVAALEGRSPRRVLLVHGEGGIGKTTLLSRLRVEAVARGRAVALLDGRDVDPTPQGVTDALARAWGATAPDGAVLLVDHAEVLAPLDRWLREELLPALPGDAVVAVAGRHPPAPGWRTDPGWREVVAVHPLGPLPDADAEELLAVAGVTAADRPRLAALGRGHPLALALLADAAARGAVPAALVDVPDLVAALTSAVLDDAPDEAHTVGLLTSAIAWLTTEDLLRRTVGDAAPAVWDWLAARPFMAQGPRGLALHDLAREVLEAELDRRSPERRRWLHRIVHDHAVDELRAAGGPDRQLAAVQLLFLHRRSPLTSTFWALRARGAGALAPARIDEAAQAVAVLERFEGPESAALASAWFAERPGDLQVVRQGEEMAGFVLALLHPTGSPLEERDPVVRAVLEHVRREDPVRPGEQVHIIRILAGVAEHQRDPYAVLASSIAAITDWLTRPLAWSFTTVVDTEFWRPFFDYLGLTEVGEVGVGAGRVALFGMDWRRIDVDAWLDLMNEREQTGATGPVPATLLRPRPLSRDAFAVAVRAALRDLHRPDVLAASPLVGTRLAVGLDGPSPEALRATLVEAVARLGRDARHAGLCRVLDRTFVRAAPTQEAAAEVLGLPFSTYRRHLGRAIDVLTDLLWAVEIGEVRLGGAVSTDRPPDDLGTEHPEA